MGQTSFYIDFLVLIYQMNDGRRLKNGKALKIVEALNVLFVMYYLFFLALMKHLGIKKPPDLWTRGDPNVFTTE